MSQGKHKRAFTLAELLAVMVVNVVLGDSSVQQITSPRLQSMLADQVAMPNELLVP